MTEDVYRKLQEHLNQHPMGYPATKSGVEIALLKKLFEEEEAQIALALTPKPESPEEIAAKLDYDSRVMNEKLNRMARRGLVVRRRKNDKDLFNLEPYVVGIYEFQIARLDREYIALHEKYRGEGLGPEIFGSQTPYFRVIPVEKNIPSDLMVLPHQRVSEIINNAEKVGVTDCICRTKRKMTGNPCGHTIQNCMMLSPWAEFYAENGWGRIISKDEAFETLNQAEKEGLVHNTQNTASGAQFICNCCSCSCGPLMAVKNLKLHGRMGRSFYLAKVDSDLCTGCEDCVDRCHFGAISMKGQAAQINEGFCMGCGLCTSSCPTGAISLMGKPEDQLIQPLPNLEAMFDQIGKEKGRSMKVVLE
jgi:H+/Na+-translocating ferredoxin:NAD+ oxidoreductase subunit B